MTAPAVILKDAFYDVDAIRRTLGLRPGTVEKARLSGALRSTKRGGRVLIRGDWLETWLVGVEQPRSELATAQ
jgi:hypothetical protein